MWSLRLGQLRNYATLCLSTMMFNDLILAPNNQVNQSSELARHHLRCWSFLLPNYARHEQTPECWHGTISRAYLRDVNSGFGEVDRLMRHEKLDVAVLQGLQCKHASARSHCGLIQWCRSTRRSIYCNRMWMHIFQLSRVESSLTWSSQIWSQFPQSNLVLSSLILSKEGVWSLA